MTEHPTALLEIDWQRWIVELGHDDTAVDRARAVRALARVQGWPIVCSRFLSPDRDDPLRADPDGDGARFVDGFTPDDGDALVTKHARDVFDTPATDRLLRRLGTRRLILTGIATDHGVRLAASSALERGMQVTVVADACAATSGDAHHRALTELGDAGARVVTATQLALNPSGRTYSIAEAAEHSGLSRDTLRWYESQSLIPWVGRDANGYRAYDDAVLRLLDIIVRLRRTGMPVRSIKEFVQLSTQGAATHGRRIALLEDHRAAVQRQIAELSADLDAIDAKVAHYTDLIDRGLDCGELPITDPTIRHKQRSRS